MLSIDHSFDIDIIAIFVESYCHDYPSISNVTLTGITLQLLQYPDLFWAANASSASVLISNVRASDNEEVIDGIEVIESIAEI
jgi:hypothetical protein